jgi:hypothetical protein
MRRSMLCAAAMLMTGCASITDGTSQTLIIPVTPKEARCSVVRSDVELGTITGTSPTITVSKGARDIIVNCSAPGYLNKSSRLVSSTQTEGMMSVLFLDFGITDMVTGAMWKYPASSSIVLERDPSALPPAALAPAPAPIAPGQASTISVDMNQGAPAPAPPTGKDAVVAERTAKELGCTRDTSAKLVSKGPGHETYSFACMNGETLILRCEWGNCRALR